MKMCILTFPYVSHVFLKNLQMAVTLVILMVLALFFQKLSTMVFFVHMQEQKLRIFVKWKKNFFWGTRIFVQKFLVKNVIKSQWLERIWYKSQVTTKISPIPLILPKLQPFEGSSVPVIERVGYEGSN